MFRKHSANENRLEYERRSALITAIEDSKKGSKGLELIVGINPENRYGVARELSHVGKITHVFKSVPYLSILTNSDDAAGMVRAISNQGNGFFYQLFRRERLKSVYLSSRFSISAGKSSRSSIRRSETVKKLEKCVPWHLERICAKKAQKYASGKDIIISVIDTGVDYDHPHLSDHFGDLKGYDFVDGNESPKDKNGHGTHVAGTCVCYEHGVAPDAMLYSVRMLDESGSGSEADLMAAMEWSADHGAHIWNMSLGSPNASRALEEMVYYFCGKGFYIVAASGNDGGRFRNFPAYFKPVMSCAATDFDDSRAYFSNVNDGNDISAPGVEIESCNDILSGTSMSTPQVSGVLALALSVAKSNSIEQIMKETARDLGDEEEYGAGLVQADKLAQAVSDGNYMAKKVFGKIKDVVW